jgi:glycosyltransferase involved in cell wall biosynthesis
MLERRCWQATTMRILWFSNRAFSSHAAKDSGTWLAPLGRGLVASGEVDLCNVTTGDVATPTRQDDGPIEQWLVPPSKAGPDGLPEAQIVADIVKLVRDFAPEIVHIWGTEGYWGLLTARRLLDFPALLEIQGLKEPYARVYGGGLTRREQIRCIGLREIVRRGTSIASGRRSFENWSRFEREIIAGHRYITTQSPWVEAWVRASNRSAQLFHTELALREPFYNAKPWSGSENAVVFCSVAYSRPYKGLHDAVRAFALLKKDVPHARLRVAGSLLRSTGIRRDGYTAWMKRLANTLHVGDSIDWLGPLSAADIVTELQDCAVMLMPSHCETYCVAMAEALYLGVPVVSAHTGGTDWLARDGRSALFFSAGDEVMSSYQLCRALTDQSLVARMSANARAAAAARNDLSAIATGQIERYRTISEGRSTAASW